jgi:hypothetical protein
MRRFSRTWFKNFVQGPFINDCEDAVTTDVAAPTNHFQVLGARAEANAANYAGLTFQDGNFTNVYGEQIAGDCQLTTAVCAAGEQASMNRFVTDHECGHEFRVNNCSGLHDGRPAWCGAAGGTCVDATLSEEKCVMYNGNAPGRDMDLRSNGINHFCKEDLLLGDMLCPGTPSPGAIRTWEDPQ